MHKTPVSIILAASAFAAHKHRDQRRKGADASPYINHPIAVANVLANEGGITDDTVLAAALLHDTIEDTDTNVEELQAEFGPDVAAIVVEVTDDKSLPKQDRKRLQIEHAATFSAQAKLRPLTGRRSASRNISCGQSKSSTNSAVYLPRLNTCSTTPLLAAYDQAIRFRDFPTRIGAIMSEVQHGLTPAECLRLRERYLPQHPRIIFRAGIATEIR